MSGGVIIARNLWDDPAFQNEPFSEREAWVWMICEAAWKPRQKRVGKVVVELQRGQLAASIRFMAEAFSWHRNKVDRLLKRLEKCNLIRVESGTGVNVITLCKYNEYQLSPKSSGTAAGQQRDSSGTNDNKGNKGNKVIEEEPIGSLSSSDDVMIAFDAYNQLAEEIGWPIARVLSKPRRASLKARLADAGGIDGWHCALEKARASPLCNGRNNRGWKADLDFLLQQKSFTRLMEGSYDDRTNNTNGSGSGGSRNAMVDAFAAVAAERTARNGGN